MAIEERFFGARLVFLTRSSTVASYWEKLKSHL